MQRALAFARTCTAAAASGTSSQLALAGSSSSPRAWFSTSARLWQQHKLGQLDRRLQITFTCTAPLSSSEKLALERSKDGEHEAAPVAQEGDEAVACGHRSTHEFSRRSYEKGIVLVECPSCKRRHLIADNLSWFASTPSPAHPTGLPIGHERPFRNVEDLMREKGELVRWDHSEQQGDTWEVSPDDDSKLSPP